jgi:hypothetical protein
MADFGISEAILIASALPAAGSAYGTYAAGEAQGKAADYNQQSADMQAQQARDAAAIAEEEARERNARLQGMARARASASGVVTSEGSPLLVLMDNAAQAELEAQRIRYGGEVRAAGLESESRLQGAYGANARTAGAIGTGVSLLSSASNIGQRYAARAPIRVGTSRIMAP